MSRDDDIIASVKHAVEQLFLPLHDTVQNYRAELAAIGRYDENSAGAVALKRRCSDGYRGMCVAAVSRVAEIAGEDSVRYAESVGRILKEMQPRIIELFGWNSRLSRASESMKSVAAEQRAKLQAEMDAEVDQMMRDLGLGIAGGVSMKTRPHIHIDNRGGSGQFVVNSPNSLQAGGRDQIATTIDFSSLAQVLTDVRQQVAQAEIPSDDRDAIEDAIVAVEREVAQNQPDQGRIKRLVLGVGKLVRDVGVSVAAQAITAYAKANGLM